MNTVNPPIYMHTYSLTNSDGSTITLHKGIAAEHVRQALDYRQASEAGDPVSARYEAESFRAARKEAYLADEDNADRLPPAATAAICVAAWVLLAMLAYAVAVISSAL